MCSMEEEAAFKAFAAQPNLHEHIFSKVAPNIFGHADIKKAVACLLFGGARKVSFSLLFFTDLQHPPVSHLSVFSAVPNKAAALLLHISTVSLSGNCCPATTRLGCLWFLTLPQR